MKTENVEFMMEAMDIFMYSLDQVVYNSLNWIFNTMPEPSLPAVALPENSFFSSVEDLNNHHSVASANGPAPLVQGDTAFMTWYKMLSLYTIWGWISMACPTNGAILMFLTNDGGIFYNECYYMFYNGVVWYNPPAPYERVGSGDDEE